MNTDLYVYVKVGYVYFDAQCMVPRIKHVLIQNNQTFQTNKTL